jgi:uncharacterized protein (DUF58 family)
MPAERADTLLRRLRWTVLRPLATHVGGDERSIVRGPGMELTEVREYQPGDDVRHIDWNVTARSGGERPYVREALTDRATDVWLVVDVSASVDWGTARCLKRDLATEFTVVAAEMLGRHGNRVGVLLFAAKPVGFVPPGAGRQHVLRVLAAVREEPRERPRGRTDLADALRRVRALARRRSLLLIVSDFLVPDGWQDGLARLAARHEVVAVVVRDPREAELPDVGLITLEDPETGEQLVLDTSDARLRERFRRAAQEQAGRLRTELTQRGVEHVVLGTERELLPALTRFLEIRRRRRTARGVTVSGVPGNGTQPYLSAAR